VTHDLDHRLSDLMRRAQDGDRRAYEDLLGEVALLVRAYTRKRIRQPDARDEIVQDTLLAIHRDRHSYDPARPFGPWMYAIAHHRLVDHVTRLRRRSENEVMVDADLEETTPPQTLSRFLRQALSRLSSKQREIIHMLKLEGYSVAEIASQTGLSQSAVKVTAHRGYKKLRELIGERE
jgi:RNA polymerase sigma-70 factor (ECF subfamily)